MFRSKDPILLVHGYTKTYEIIMDNIYITLEVRNALN
jgi:hypothetical protein